MTAKSDVIVKLVLVFFISLLSFSIGTFVGKKYSDNQHRLASLEPSGHGSRDVASADAAHSAPVEGQPVSDEDIAKLAEEFAMEEETVMHPSEQPAKTDAHHAKTDTHATESTHKVETNHAAPVKEAAKPVVAKMEPSTHEPMDAAKKLATGQNTGSMVKAAEQESRVPSSLPKDVAQYSVGKFTVQVASFKVEDDARKKAEDLKSRGYGAFYFPANIKGETWYRVGVGLFPTEDDAKNYRREFSAKNKITDAVIQRIVN